MALCFFKQKTAYEMRSSDWSSDVCSSDLEFEPDDEQQQSDAEFGDPHLRFGAADQPEHLRPDDRARDEETQRRAQPELAEQEHEAEREPGQQHAVPQQRGDRKSGV